MTYSKQQVYFENPSIFDIVTFVFTLCSGLVSNLRKRKRNMRSILLASAASVLCLLATNASALTLVDMGALAPGDPPRTATGSAPNTNGVYGFFSLTTPGSYIVRVFFQEPDPQMVFAGLARNNGTFASPSFGPLVAEKSFMGTSGTFLATLALAAGNYILGFNTVTGGFGGGIAATGDFDYQLSVSAVPVPGAIALFGAGLAVLAAAASSRKQRRKRTYSFGPEMA
jgi:hypothetical protein